MCYDVFMLFLLGNRHRDSDSTSFQGVSGVSLADEDTVFTSMELFCTRVRSMLDIINTLAQFGKLSEAVKDLPRLPREVLSPEEEVTGEDEGDEEQGKDISRTISDTSFEEGMGLQKCKLLKFNSLKAWSNEDESTVDES